MIDGNENQEILLPIFLPFHYTSAPESSHSHVNDQEKWEAILESLAHDISRVNLITWFQRTAILSYETGVLTIGIPREFFLSWHLKNSRSLIASAAKQHFPDLSSVEFMVDGKLENDADGRAVDILDLFPSGKSSVRKLPKKAEVLIGGEIKSKMLSSKYTLQNFVVGPENRLAFAACKAIAAAPGGEYNPLFIYGGSGLGKTHLLQGAGHEIMNRHEKLVVLYLTAENFVNELIEAIQKRKMEKVREKYRKVDVLAIDDIQFFAGKDRSQEIFFHIFNEFYDSGKQIILSSDRPPSELELTEDRLKSRFSMGMVVDVQFPDYETRIAILQMKAREQSMIIENEILNFIAFNIHHSVRELEGVLKQVKAQEDFEGVKPSVQSVAQIIRKLYRDQNIVGYDEDREVHALAKTMDDIVEKVADFYSTTKSDILGPSRKREFVVPRQVAMFFSKKHLNHSLEKIGIFFGNRDHTSVIHAINQVVKKKKIDAQFWKDVNTIRKEMGF